MMTVPRSSAVLYDQWKSQYVIVDENDNITEVADSLDELESRVVSKIPLDTELLHKINVARRYIEGYQG